MNTDKLLEMLLDAIDYSFLQNDGSYDKTLTYPVIDKIQYIRKQLKNNEPICEDLEEEIKRYLHKIYDRDTTVGDVARHFADWQKEQMMANAIDAEVLENYDGKVIEYDETILDKKLSNCKVFDKVKVIVVKGEKL